MRQPIAVLLILLAACSQAVCRPTSASITTLPNGLTVITQEDHTSELVGIDIWVKAGTRFETRETNGVSHFLEHLLFGVTEKRKAGDMDREMESLGATLDAHTNRDYAHFSTTISSRYLTKALDILSDAVLHSQFPESSVQMERLVILDEIARKQSNANSVCQDLLSASVFGDHPYSLPLEGTAQSIKALSRQDIVDYYHLHYVPGNIAVVLVGDFDKAAVSAVAAAFGSDTSTAPAKPPQVTPAARPKSASDSVKMDFNNNYLTIGFLGPPAANTDEVCAMDVLVTYLGRGYHSWLSDELKVKQGLAQEGSADFVTAHDPGLVSIVAMAPPTHIPRAREAILGKLAQMGTVPIDAFELGRAKRSLLGQYAFQDETVGGRAGTLGFYYAVSDPLFAARYEANVQAVTADAVRKLAKQYLDRSGAAVIAVGPDQGGSK